MTEQSVQEIHEFMGQYGRLYLDLQQARIAMNNRIKAIERHHNMDKPQVVLQVELASKELRLCLDRSELEEGRVQRMLERIAKEHPLADWVAGTRGFGYQSLSLLVAIAGPLDLFPTVSKLWKYMGMSVDDGHAPKRQRGARIHYSPQGRVFCHQLGESIVKVGGPYRVKYDDRKAKVSLRQRVGPSECPFGQSHKDADGKVMKCVAAHIHNDAMRYAVKCLLRDLWVEWHRVLGSQAIDRLESNPRMPATSTYTMTTVPSGLIAAGME